VRPTGRGAERSGAALVTVVLLTLALFVLGQGMLVLALGEVSAARAALRLLEARAAAEGAVADAIRRPPSAWLDSVPVGGSRESGGPAYGRASSSITLLRLAPEAWWVEGEGRSGSARARTARLAWALDPLERVLELRGAVTVGAGASAILEGALELAAPATAAPPLTASDCAPWADTLDAHYLSSPLLPVAVLDPADTLPALGPIDVADLLALASIRLNGSGAPAPVEVGGVCVTSEAWNLGDPERPWRPCGDHLPLRGAVGDLVLAGGPGQAVLIVDGDVTLAAGARLFGLVVASGELRLEGGAELAGMALAFGGVRVASGARIDASGCWAALALARQRATLGELRLVPGIGRLGPLG
jgi:hypothetical protein